MNNDLEISPTDSGKQDSNEEDNQFGGREDIFDALKKLIKQRVSQKISQKS